MAERSTTGKAFLCGLGTVCVVCVIGWLMADAIYTKAANDSLPVTPGGSTVKDLGVGLTPNGKYQFHTYHVCPKGSQCRRVDVLEDLQGQPISSMIKEKGE